MLNTETFSEVFEEILQKNQSDMSMNSGWESTLDPFGMATLMSLADTHHFSLHIAARAYKIKPIKPITSPPHAFSPIQFLSFEYLKNWAPALADNFTARELKAAYRSAVLKTHPDMGGNSETFQDVRKSYQILEALVKNEL